MRSARLLALLIPLATILAGPAPVVAAGHVVRITSTLDPSRLTIAPGDTVTFRNDDDERHRLRSRGPAGEFDTGDLDPGESFRVVLTTAGSYAYIDERNDDIERYWGRIVVADQAEPTPTDPDTGGGTAGGGGATGGGTTVPAAATIRLANRAFSPRSVTIAAGGSVTWRNDDDRDHTASSRSGAFDSGVLSSGESHRETFPTAGTFAFLCFIHPEMTGTVTVVGASGGGTAGAGRSAPQPTPRPTRTPTATPRPSVDRPDTGSVSIVDLDFDPGVIEVAVGDSVTWTNTGVAPHSATAADGSFDSGVLDPGSTFTRTFATAGSYQYACVVHPSMTGTVVVLSSGNPATAPPGSPAAGGAGVSDATGADPTAGAGPEDLGASIVGTLIAIGLIAGALMVGTGLLLEVVRRGRNVPEAARTRAAPLS